MTIIAKSPSAVWYVYILSCGNGALYTGVTTDVGRRLGEHTEKGRLAARYTRAFAPVRLVYSCRVGSKRLSHQIEYRIKQLSKEKKKKLVAGQPSRSVLLDFLSMTDDQKKE